MTFQKLSEAINFINTSSKIEFDDSFNLAKYCSYLVRQNESEARDLTIRVLDVWEKFPEKTMSIWNDLIEAVGLYPYLEPTMSTVSSLLRYESHKSRFLQDVYLHAEQLFLSVELQNKNSVVTSAPTSFGKSLLIEEVVASKIYKNIVIIQPTLALLDETRKKLSKYNSDYKLVVSTNQLPSNEKGNLFLFTGERVVEYENFPEINFFVIDEFYKLSLERDDDRAIALNQAMYKLLKFTNHFYLLGPNIRSIPTSFREKLKLTWFPSSFATVAVDEINVDGLSGLKAAERKARKKGVLFDLLSKQTDQTLIYCSSPNRATELAIEFVMYLEGKDVKLPNVNENGKIIEWVGENIHSSWSLIKALNHGVAFHHGAVPRHLGNSIVENFNKATVRWLFCTSTLIEGVNTSAKNVILFDKEKGRKPIDFFDYKNIAGRSGRMTKYFKGNVIRFENQPEQVELELDIPLFDQEKAPLEILIGIDENEIEEVGKKRLENFNGYSEDLKELLKSNSGVSIEGQLSILNKIESNIPYYHNMLSWSANPPSFNHLATIIDLCWDTLGGAGDKPFITKIGRLSARWLAAFTFSYINTKSLTGMIIQYYQDDFWVEKIPDEQERIDIVSFTILHISRHWFDYKLPKWLAVVSSIQDYVFSSKNMKSGDFTYLSSMIENGFLSSNLAALLEYGIPTSAIKKLSREFEKDDTPEQMVLKAKQLSQKYLKEIGLIDYEIDKLKDM